MEKIKTILDRKPLSSDYISSKQDFGKVLKGVQHLKPPVWKSAWFYGTVGVAAIAVVVTAVSLSGGDSKNTRDELATTQVQETISTKKQTTKPKTNTALLAQNDQLPQENTVQNPSTPEPVHTEISETQIERTENTPVVVEEETTEEARTVKNTMPHIAGVFNGAIPFDDFCDPNGIQVNNDIEILSYTIQYYSCTRDVTANIRGSKIPETVCQEIGDCGQRIMVYMTNIKGRDVHTGEIHIYPHLNLLPTK